MRRCVLILAVLVCLFAAARAEELPEAYLARREQLEARLAGLDEKYTAPCVYITTEEGREILSREEYVPAVIDVFGGGEAYRLTAPGGVKVRGNSTANGDEKPYRIKFDKKQNMLGLHGGEKYKSWVLLRSQWNLAMDYTALKLAAVIFGGRYYVSDCAFVNLFINGESKGIYVLCEQNQAAGGRLQVHEPKEDETGTDIGYLLELDNYPSDEHPWFRLDDQYPVRDIDGTYKILRSRAYSVKSGMTSGEQFAFIERWLRGTYRILYMASVYDRPMMFDEAWNVVSAEGVYDTAWEAVCAVIDPDSLADTVILEELVHDNDVGEGSFYMAVDFSEESIYPRLTFAGPWDFNWAYNGEADGGYYAVTYQPDAAGTDRSSGWMIMAMRMPAFQALVQEKWAALAESGALEAAADAVMADCELLRGDLGRDAWKVDCARDVVNFVRGRISWLDTQWR